MVEVEEDDESDDARDCERFRLLPLLLPLPPPRPLVFAEDILPYPVGGEAIVVAVVMGWLSILPNVVMVVLFVYHQAKDRGKKGGRDIR